MRTAETLNADSELSIDDLDKVAGGCNTHKKDPAEIKMTIYTDDDGKPETPRNEHSVIIKQTRHDGHADVAFIVDGGDAVYLSDILGGGKSY